MTHEFMGNFLLWLLRWAVILGVPFALGAWLF